MLASVTDVELAAARWLTYVAALILIGAPGARFAFRNAASVADARSFNRVLARLVIVGGALWIVACLCTLVAQLRSWFGPQAFNPDRAAVLLTQTVWGAAWMRQALAAVLGLCAGLVGLRWPRTTVATGVLIAAGAALTIPWTGHASGHSGLAGWLHVVHLLGAGVWLGTLAVVTAVAWPHWQSKQTGTVAIRPVLVAFSPIALFGASLVVASGSLLTLEHVRPIGTILQSTYGQALACKIVGVICVAALGGLNWRRLRQPGTSEQSARGVRDGAALELAVTFLVVLFLTAWLSGLPMPE
jgi:putative copper resistance protein D